MEVLVDRAVAEHGDDARLGARQRLERGEADAAGALRGIAGGANHIAAPDPEEEIEALLRGEFDKRRQRGQAVRAGASVGETCAKLAALL